MKQLFILLITVSSTTLAFAQDVKKDLATAKAAYNANKLEDAHFALQQSLQSLDIAIGKEVLKLLPEKMDTMKVNSREDRVTGNVSFVGATIHRRYGSATNYAEVEIVNNSPLLGTLNAFLTSPLLAGLANDGKSRVLKIQGYKSRLTKEDDGDNSSLSYKLEIPFSNALVTVNVKNAAEDQVVAMAQTIPLEKIAELIQ